jgi:hypothetical protein
VQFVEPAPAKVSMGHFSQASILVIAELGFAVPGGQGKQSFPCA